MFTRSHPRATTRSARIAPQRSSIPLGAGPAAAMALPMARQTRAQRSR